MILLATLLTLFISAVTIIPFSVGLLAVSVVLYRKPWVFLLALGLGLFLDLNSIRSLGYSSFMFTVFVFLLFLYERKFETQTAGFVFISTLAGSLVYLKILGYNNALIQSLVSAIIGILLFRLIKNSTKSAARLKD